MEQDSVDKQVELVSHAMQEVIIDVKLIKLYLQTCEIPLKRLSEGTGIRYGTIKRIMRGEQLPYAWQLYVLKEKTIELTSPNFNRTEEKL